MPDFGENDPLSAAVRGRGGLYNLSTATQPGQNPLDRPLIDQAIDARNNLDQRRQLIVNQLPFANRHQARALTAELHGIDMAQRMDFARQRDAQRQANFEANQARLLSHTQALEADKAIRRERDTRIDQMGADAMIRMDGLDKAYRSGQISKEQFDDGMLGLGQTHFEALHRHPEAAKHWAAYLDQDQKMSAYQERLSLREAAKLQARYGVPIQTDPNSGEIDFDAMHRAAMGTPRGQGEALGHLNNEMLKRYGLPASAVFEHAAGGRMENEKDPNSFEQTDPADTKNPQTHVRMTVVSPTGHQQNIIMPKDHFDHIKGEFQPAYDAITSATQAAASPGASPSQPASALQIGTQRTINGVQAEWDGTGWKRAQ